MKNIPFFFILFLLTPALFSQKIPKFGKIDKASLLSTSCNLMPDADAEVLIDEGFTRFEYNSGAFFKMINERRIRIKIYTQKGMAYANVQLGFLRDADYERIYNISGHSFTITDGEIIRTKLEKKLIYEQKVNELFARVSFSFPNVIPGSIIEYRFQTEKKSFSNIDPWIFQREIPVRISSYTLQIPEYFKFTAKSLVQQNIEKKENNEIITAASSEGIQKMMVTNFNYQLKNIPQLKAEPMMSSLKDYTQRIEFQLSEINTPTENFSYTKDWADLANELMDNKLFGEQINRKLHFPDLDTLMQGIKYNEDKIKILMHYFKKNYTWNGIQDFYALDLKKMMELKNGSSGDLNLLFLNILKKYKIEAYPLLVSTKDNGAVNTDYPFLKQFNAVHVLIPHNNTYIILNAADKYNSNNLIPIEIINTYALKILKDTCVWMHLSDATMMEFNKINFRADVDEYGTVTGSAFIKSLGYAKPQRLQLLESDTNKYIIKYFTHDKMKITFSNLQFKQDSRESTELEQQFDFQAKIVSGGAYSLLYYNLFSGFNENPFLSEKRNSDIDFYYPRKFTINAYLNIAAAYDFEALPGNIILQMSDTGIIFERFLTKEDNVLTIRLNFSIVKSNYYSTNYLDLRKYYQKLFDLLNEPILLFKKKK